MTTKRTYALLDCHSICHAAKHRTKRLTFRGVSTGVIYGFLNTLLKLQGILKPDVWVFAWDSKQSVRRDARPSYKANRLVKKSPEEIRLNRLTMPQFDIIRDDILPAMGFNNVIKVEGFEGDDIMAQVIVDGNPEDNFIMIARDNDMLQMLAPNVTMYDHVKNKHYTAQDFSNDWFGLQPRQWALVKALAGCKTDNVDGLRGIGEKTATQMLVGLLGDHTKAYEAIMAPENQAIAQANIDLVELPHSEMPPVSVSNVDRLGMRGFAEVCNTFGLKSFLKDANWHKWMEAFNVE